MTRALTIKFGYLAILVFMFVVAANSCKSQGIAINSCWPKMEDGFAKLHNSVSLQTLDSDRAAVERESLRISLESCIDNVEYVYSSIPSESAYNYTTLLDVAIAADDRELTARVIERIGHGRFTQAVRIDPNSNDNHPLFLAVRLESLNAFEALLTNSLDPHVVDHAGFSLLHVAGGQTESGLKLLVRLIKLGLDVNSRTEAGLTPVLAARSRGDIGAVVCLLTNGASAEEPSIVMDSSPINKNVAARRIRIDEILRGDLSNSSIDSVKRRCHMH